MLFVLFVSSQLFFYTNNILNKHIYIFSFKNYKTMIKFVSKLTIYRYEEISHC